MNITIPLRQLLLSVSDSLGKMTGILTTIYGSNVSNQFICKTCGFVAKNPGSLASHNKVHKEN